MKIKRLVIENFKSIERIELVEPNPFTVFVGPNGSGKSNIFEALEFVNLQGRIGGTTGSLFGGPESFLRKQNNANRFDVKFEPESFATGGGFYRDVISEVTKDKLGYEEFGYVGPYTPQFGVSLENSYVYNNFTRLFVGNEKLRKLSLNDDQRLALDASNLEKVLKRILADNTLKNEIFEWLELFVPEFKAVEIDERDELHWFEEFAPKYFTKDLISDGTYHILAMLTAVYQSDDKPQFLCIEEPENGLNPKVIKELVNLCRYACEEFGHHIWLNTHSQSLVSQLNSDEIILVDKKEGATQIKQIKGMNLHGLPMDEAWLSNALGGGLPW